MSITSNEAQLSLLTRHEKTVCVKIAAVGEAPYNLRARALLALDDGVTQQEAVDRSGLSLGQLKYWLARFRENRLEIFPDELLSDNAEDEPVFGYTEAPPQEMILPESQKTAHPEAEPEIPSAESSDKKAKKKKKGKKEKSKKKKDKKDKKTSKGKKKKKKGKKSKKG